MNQKLSLIILDADIIIDLNTEELWDKVLSLYNILITETVLDELIYYRDKNGTKVFFDKDKLSAHQKITIVSSSPGELQSMKNELDRLNCTTWFDSLDDGERESISYIFNNFDGSIKICLKEVIGIKATVILGLSSECLSLETILKQIGINKKLNSTLTDVVFSKIVEQAKVLRTQSL